ncbi:hypothetical protein VNO77_02762 [Canavalia gladiata]|uniref:Uncharacterized protein n=1 Tax=Canavalia gladiata TaxID=3824 RepID=A0AAN9RBK4_CANGL
MHWKLAQGPVTSAKWSNTFYTGIGYLTQKPKHLAKLQDCYRGLCRLGLEVSPRFRFTAGSVMPCCSRLTQSTLDPHTWAFIILNSESSFITILEFEPQTILPRVYMGLTFASESLANMTASVGLLESIVCDVVLTQASRLESISGQG